MIWSINGAVHIFNATSDAIIVFGQESMIFISQYQHLRQLFLKELEMF